MILVKWLIALSTVLVLSSCTTASLSIVEVKNPSPITVRQFDAIDASLSETLMVTLDDGHTEAIEVEWETPLETFDTTEHGSFEIKGALRHDAFEIPETITPIQEVTVKPGSIDSALAVSDDTTHFKTMYAHFDHPDKTSAQTVFVPNNAAINDVLQFLEMDLDALLAHSAFESLMLDHMSEERITTNRLNTNVPGVYDTLRDQALIVEGELGNPLIDNAHQQLHSYDLDGHFLHVIDGMILSEDTLSVVGSDLFDDAMGERLLEILRNQGLLTDILLGRSFTLFMPEQSALLAYAQNEGVSLSTLLESETFETLILGHIVREAYSAETLYTSAPLTLKAVNGASIDITVTDGNLHAANARVTNTETIDQIGTLLTIDAFLAFAND